MKIFIKSLLALLVVLGVASCSKELSQETGAVVNTGNNFTATINGQPWKADSLEQVVVTDSVVTIYGVSSTSQEISLVLPNFAVGKYTVNASTAGYGLYTTLGATATDVYLTNTSVEVAKAGGTIEISSIDTLNKTVTGTFSFTAYRATDQTTVVVSNGVFKALAYSSTTSGGGITDSAIADNGRDTLSIFIDGTLFKADPPTISGVTSDFGGGMVTLLLAGAENSGATMTINFPVDITPGTHAMDYPNSGVIYSPDGGAFYAPLAPLGSGTFKILTNDQTNKRVTGQFSFTGVDVTSANGTATKKFTQGYFGVSYQ